MTGRARWVLAAALAGVLLGGCTADSPRSDSPGSGTPSPVPSTTTTQPAKPPPRPELLSCHRLTYDEALAPTDDDPRTVDCAKPHTSQTFSVGRLDTTVDGHLLAVDSRAVREHVAARCPSRLAPFLGATSDELRLSMARAVWFTPSVEESDAGADWFRCDVIVVAGADRLVKVRGGLKGALATSGGRTAYGMCGTAEPGTEGFERVPCAEEHSWRAIDSVDLKPGKKGRYPGADAAREAGQTPCAEAARAVAEDALDYEWGYEWPTREQWRAGQTYGRCWAPD